MEEMTTIEVSEETWTRLHRRKEQDETLDDVLQELLTG